MNDHTIALVRESFDLIEPIAPQAGEMFCNDLAQAEPSLQPLFGGDKVVAGAALIAWTARVIAHLDEPDALTPLLDHLGRVRAGFGLTDAHDPTIVAVMLRTLYQCLGVAYNAEVEEAWVDLYGELAAKMKQAATAPQLV